MVGDEFSAVMPLVASPTANVPGCGFVTCRVCLLMSEGLESDVVAREMDDRSYRRMIDSPLLARTFFNVSHDNNHAELRKTRDFVLIAIVLSTDIVWTDNERSGNKKAEQDDVKCLHMSLMHCCSCIPFQNLPSCKSVGHELG